MTRLARETLVLQPRATTSAAGELAPLGPREVVTHGPFRGLDALDLMQSGLASKRWVGLAPTSATTKTGRRFARNLVVALVKRLLATWYDVKVEKKTPGLDGPIKGALLLLTPHTGIDDPPLVYANIWRQMPAIPVATEGVFVETGTKSAMRILGGFPVPDTINISGASDEIDLLAVQVTSALRRAEASPGGYGNVGIHVAGEILRDDKDAIGANSLIGRVLALKPDTRLIAVVPRGLNGSPMSRAGQTQFPTPAAAIAAYGSDLVHNFKRFPFRSLWHGAVKERRQVTIELHDVTEQLRAAGSVRAQNLILEQLGNKPCAKTGRINPAWYVPRRHDDPRPLETFATPERPRPELRAIDASKAAIVADACMAHVRAIARVNELTRDTALADLGLDSLTISDHVVPWVNTTYGRHFTTAEAFVTVGDIIDAATGALPAMAGRELKPVSQAFLEQTRGVEPARARGANNALQDFVQMVRATPQRIVLVDETMGEVTAAQLASLVSLLLPDLEKTDRRVGLLMQNGAVSTATQLALALAGKTPVMLDPSWTDDQLRCAMEVSGATRVLTSQTMIRRLKAQKRASDTTARASDAKNQVVDVARTPFPSVEERFFPIEQVLRDASDWRALTAGLFFDRRLKSMERRARQISGDAPAAVFVQHDAAGAHSIVRSHAQLAASLAELAKKLDLTTGDVILHLAPACEESSHLAGLLPAVASVPAVCVDDPRHIATAAELGRLRGATVAVASHTTLAELARENPTLAARARLAVTGGDE